MSGRFDSVGGATIRDVVEIHFKDLIFAIQDFGGDCENGLFNFPADSTFWGQESNFNQLLGDGGASLEPLTGGGFVEGADNPAGIKTVVTIKIFIFNTDGGLFYIGG
ncbi:MAG: hypothetical protein UX37_C0001G0005 [Microgenomates group bacterium GW2011_GWA2_46_16]|nr:MAG: hypothetical protein UX37_C0001G0005 [Microgenomates group bacterium GW2011_GWA2_46_16]